MTERLRVAVVGAGAISQVAHLPVLSRRDDVQVVGLCDNDLGKARALANRFRVADVYDDIEDLLQHASPHVVAVCTPNHLHEIHVKIALSAGAHVLCERPLATSATGALAVSNAQRATGKVVLAGMNHRYRSDVQTIRSFIERGELGRIHAIRCGWYTFRPSRQMMGWRQRRAQAGGGALLDLGLPLIDLSTWLAGPDCPRRVTASTSSVSADSSEVEDAGCVMMTCDGGTSIVVDVSWRYVGASERWWCEVLGSEGSAMVSPFSVHKEMHGSAVNVTPTGAASRESVFMTSYGSQWADFLTLVRGEGDVPNLDDQVRLHRILDCAYETAQAGTIAEL